MSLLKDSRAVLSPRGPGRLVCQVPSSHQPGKASRKGTRATRRDGEQTPPGQETHHPRTLDGSCCPLPRSAPAKGAQMRLFSFQSLRHQGGPGQSPRVSDNHRGGGSWGEGETRLSPAARVRESAGSRAGKPRRRPAGRCCCPRGKGGCLDRTQATEAATKHPAKALWGHKVTDTTSPTSEDARRGCDAPAWEGARNLPFAAPRAAGVLWDLRRASGSVASGDTVQ